MMYLGIIFLILIIATYPKWSYRQWHHRCEEDVVPFTGKLKNQGDS